MRRKRGIRNYWLSLGREGRWLAISLTVCLVVHGLVCAVFAPATLVGDEGRFLLHARNLAGGSFVSAEVPEIATGPGYPLFLMPFAALGAPWWIMRGLNGFLAAGATWFVFSAARGLGLRWGAWVAMLAVGFNPILLRYSFLIRVETLAVFLMAGFVWAYCRALGTRQGQWRWIGLATFFFFALVMSRVLFGYVAITALVVVPLFCLWEKQAALWWMAVAPFVLSLVLSVPWLLYVGKATGGSPGWTANGGELLYWITTSGEHNWGSWMGEIELLERPEAAARHLPLVRRINALPLREQQAAWEMAARQNFRENPAALAKNLVANVSRAFLAFPRSHYQERLATLPATLCGAFVLFLLVFSVYPSVRGWGEIPLALKLSAWIVFLYVGGSLLLPAEPRYLLPATPVVWIWLAYVLERFVRLGFDFGRRLPSSGLVLLEDWGTAA